MSGHLRGALREGDHVEYDGPSGRQVRIVAESSTAVFINGVRAAGLGTAIEGGGAIGEHEHEVYIADLPGGQPGGEPPPLFHLHLDADRDGALDSDHRRNDEWTWDRRYPGAIALVNLDPTARYGPRDPATIAPLAVRRDPRTAGRSTDGWKGYLRVSSKFKLRILDAGAKTVLIGPESAEDRIALDLSQDETRLGMEGVQFPGLYPGPGRDPDPATASSMTGWSGQLRLELKLYDPGGQLAHHEVAQVRVAPWVAFNHADPTEAVFVSTYSDGQGIRDALAQHSGTSVRTIKQSGDQWTQDQGEMGFSTLPAADRREQRSLLALKNEALLEIGSARLLPFQTVPEIPYGNLDFGGNLECTPPFVHPDTRRVYAFGRIYYGHPAQDPQFPPHLAPVAAATRVFLDQQAIQDPFVLDTGWLTVGHIDELVCCVPMKDARLGFRVMYTSPRLAAEILAPLPDDMPVFAPYAREARSKMVRIQRPFQPPGSGPPLNMANLAINVGLLKGGTPFNIGLHDFKAMTAFVEKKLAIVRDVFKREIGLRDDDFIPVPVLFQGRQVVGRSVFAVAFSPGLANALAVTMGPTTWAGPRDITLFAPKPFGPGEHSNGSPPRAGDCLFEEAMIEALGPTAKTGVTVRFADDFVGYHLLDGEVHCGTNSLRVPPSDRVWWAPREDTRRSRP